jgi:phosphoserine aminotransferase
LIESRSAHGVCGEFSKKFAKAVQAAPFLSEPAVFEVEVGESVIPADTPGVDAYAWAQNETSTGACAEVLRPEGIGSALVLIDATSSAGGMDADISQTDAYYFSPQKNFSSDGGLWVSFCSPAVLERSARLTSSSRWIPPTLDLTLAAENSRQNQTLNTPAIATLLLLESQLEWIMERGGIDFVVERTEESSEAIYDWADAHEYAEPFVQNPDFRSPVVATIDFDKTVDAARLASVLRANGIVDLEPYRNLNRNQLRIGCYAAVDPADVESLLECIDWVIERIIAE